MNDTEELQDLTIKIIGIKFTSRFIQIESKPLNSKSKSMRFDGKINRKLNEEIVRELKIGLSYRIKQEKMLKENGKYEFRWITATNLSHQKGHTLDGLFE